MKYITFLLFIIISSGSFGSDLKSLKSFCEDMENEKRDIETISLYLEMHGFESVTEAEAIPIMSELVLSQTDEIFGRSTFTSSCLKRLKPMLLK